MNCQLFNSMSGHTGDMTPHQEILAEDIKDCLDEVGEETMELWINTQQYRYALVQGFSKLQTRSHIFCIKY
ncbi:hypothetical protein DPMN_088034 [Dreissena polymorpha]|uniref:Uncharacterized protein n=1 Tax=Dreissena polymorpha TaxID=45954 RepID=A0A9D4QWY5_DREPO|nr:hypothetical protein DPMN_088034 [Dreissena polymorpha]